MEKRDGCKQAGDLQTVPDLAAFPAARSWGSLELIAEHDALVRLQRWIAANDAVTLTLRKAATIALLEPHYFSRVFRDCVGETFVKWRRRQRISKAVELLRSGYSMGEVIALAGYRERRSLERAIRTITGATPCAARSLPHV